MIASVDSALVNWRGEDGESFFSGKTVTGLSNAEEVLIDGTEVSYISNSPYKESVFNSFFLGCSFLFGR